MRHAQDGQTTLEDLVARIEALTPASARNRDEYTELLRDIAAAAHDEDDEGMIVLDAQQVEQMLHRIVERTGMKISVLKRILREITHSDFGVGTDIERPLRDAVDDEAVKRVAEGYPLPAHGEYAYVSTKEGVMLHKVIRGKNGVATGVAIVSSPFTVVARARFVDSATAEVGLRIGLQCPRGHRVVVDVESKNLGAIATRGEILAQFMRAGLRVGSAREEVLNIIGLTRPEGEIQMVRRPGFHRIGDETVFITIDGQIIGKHVKLELAAGAQVEGRVARRRTLKIAKKLLATILATLGVPHWKIGFLIGLAGALIAYAGLGNHGINLSGTSSIGKSFAQELAVVSWSTPDGQIPGSLYRYAHATVNGLEGVAVLSNGMVMSVDELALISGRQLATLIFMFVAGTDKVRMNRNIDLRYARHWCSAAIFSHERTLEEKVRSDGGQWTAGMAARIPNIPVEGTNVALQKEQIDGYRSAIRSCYGHFGPAFAAGLLEMSVDDLKRRVAEKRQALIASTELATRQRAAQLFAILAVTGDLVHELGLLPEEIDFDGAIKWAFHSFISSALPLDPLEDAVQRLRTWIAERWDSSVRHTSRSFGAVRDAVAFYDDDCVYIPVHRLSEAAGGAISERDLAKFLKERRLTCKFKDAEHLTTDYVPGLGRMSAYALSREEFGAPKTEHKF